MAGIVVYKNHFHEKKIPSRRPAALSVIQTPRGIFSEEQVFFVRLIAFFTTIDKLTFLPIVDLLRLPDNELVLADLEHSCHHE